MLKSNLQIIDTEFNKDSLHNRTATRRIFVSPDSEMTDWLTTRNSSLPIIRQNKNHRIGCISCVRPPALFRPSLRAAIERVARAPFDGVALLIVTGRTGFGRGVPLRVCAALRVGRGKFFGKKIGYIPLLFLRIGCVNVIPILFFLPLFRFGAPFPYIRFPALRRCAEPGVSGRDIFRIFALGGLGHLLAGGTGRLLIVSSLITLGV